MATGKALNGKPYAGNPHVRFDEGAGAPRHSGRSALLYKLHDIQKNCGLIVPILAMLCVAVAPMTSFAEAKQATLLVAGYTGSTTLTDFQALVKLSASNDAYGFSYAEAEADGSDLWFTDANGNVIPHEIDTWNSSGDSLVWVKIPSLKKGTEIVMHWGDLNTKQTATENTWTGFVGVWHMNGTGTTAEPDSTTNSLSATPKITSGTANIDTATGKVGKGRSNIANARLEVASTYKNKITTASQFTVGGWFKMNRTDTKSSGSYPRILTGNGSTGTRNTWEVWQNLDANAASDTLRVLGGSNSDSIYSGTRLVASQWAYLMVVYNGAKATLYLDGVSKGEKTITAATHNNAFSIGAIGTTANRSLVGVMDEVRMYNGGLSGDRIAADYATMHTPTAFLTLVSDDTPVTAAWRTATAADGDVSNSANWACTNSAGAEVVGIPTALTDVTVSGDNLNIQIPSGASFLCKSFTLGNCSLAADCDLCGVGTVTIPSGVTVDLKDRALFVQGLAGDGVITNTANGTYTTLDYISTGAGQYIITGYTPAGDDVVSTHVNFNNAYCQSIWCSRGANGTDKTFTCITYDLNKPFFRFDRNATAPTGTRTLDVATNMHYEIIANYGTGACKVNGKTVYTMDTASYTPASALSLFRLMNNANGAALAYYETTDYKMYHFRICGADGSPKLDLVPAKNGSNVAGLWDRVSGAFYPSASSDAFNAGGATGRGELVFHVPSGVTATRSGVTIAENVIVSKEGEGTLEENALGYGKTKASFYDQREGIVRFTPSTSDYLDLGPTNFCISGGTLTPSGSHLQIGRERNGCRFTQTGGTVSMSSCSVVVGVRASAAYDLAGGELNGVNYCQLGIGDNASGTMGISGGTMTVNGEFQVGVNGAGHGEVLQTGGSVTAATLVIPVAAAASGEYRIYDGTCTVTKSAKIGYSGDGTMSVSGGTLAFNDFQIGANGTGHGEVSQTGGAVTAGTFNIPVNATASGEYCISGGTLTINNAKIGNYGSGSVIQRGGSCTINGYPQIGAESGGNGLYEMTGGTLLTTSNPLSVGRYGTGTLNVSGSAFVTASCGIRVGFTNGANEGSGTLVVTNGGTIATTSIYGAGTTAAQASVLFDNATVVATAAGEILKDLQDVTIGAGGLTVSNDFAVAVTNTTLKVTGGETAITMTGTGSLDLSHATVELSSVPTSAFDFAVANGGEIVGVPSITGASGVSVKGYKARIVDGGTRCRILRPGVMILVK